MHWAVAGERQDVVHCLVRDCKVDLNVRCYAGHTPLKLAWDMTRASPNSPSAVKIMMLLIESGAKQSDHVLYSDDSDFSDEDEEEEEDEDC